ETKIMSGRGFPPPPQPATVAAQAARPKAARKRARTWSGLQRRDAEIPALHVGVARELAGGRLGGDLAADHDQLPLGERRRDAEVLLDQQDPQAVLLARAEDLDQ